MIVIVPIRWWWNKWRASVRRCIASIIILLITFIIPVLIKLFLAVLSITPLRILRIRPHTHTDLRHSWTLIPHILFSIHILLRWTYIHSYRIVILLHFERGWVSLLIRCPRGRFILLISLFWVPPLIKFPAVLYIFLILWTKWLICLHFVIYLKKQICRWFV